MTNNKFRARVFDVVSKHLARISKEKNSKSSPSQPLADPIIPPLTPDDTGLFPSAIVNTYVACTSPWIDLCSADPVVANVSRQVLNLEVAYANFCGVRSVLIPGPRVDGSKIKGNQGLSQYGRALQEAMAIGSRLSFLVHIPMYREPGLEDNDPETLASLIQQGEALESTTQENIDIYSTWDSWHVIRTICEYNIRLFVGESGCMAEGPV